MNVLKMCVLKFVTTLLVVIFVVVNLDTGCWMMVQHVKVP